MARTKASEYKNEQKAKGRLTDRNGRIIPRDPANDKPMLEFWHAVDRSEMMEALRADNSDTSIALATYLLDPKTQGKSLSRACRDCGITLAKLNELYRNHRFAEAQIIASAHLPQIVSDTAIDARARYELCDRCDGLGTIIRTKTIDNVVVEENDTCPKCKGAREVRVSGDAKARDQVFEITGLTGKSSGPLVAIQQNIMSDDLEGTLNIAQKLLQQSPKGGS